MWKFQFHIIGCTDNITNLETADLQWNDKFGTFALQMKVSWSKNVMEERDFPDRMIQIFASFLPLPHIWRAGWPITNEVIYCLARVRMTLCE